MERFIISATGCGIRDLEEHVAYVTIEQVIDAMNKLDLEIKELKADGKNER